MRVLVIAGTRPEAIKMAPVILRLRSEPERFETKLCATAQHRQMLDQVLDLFDLDSDADLDLMRPGQSPNEVASRVFAAFDPVLGQIAPDWVLVQGDTTTAMAAALAAFHRGIRVGHVEAGLRTGDLRNPFPEEMNRRVVDVVADAYFAPTRRAADALAAERVPQEKIFLTGNTIVDALLEIEKRLEPAEEEDLVLITTHRRESFGEPMIRVVGAIARLASAFPGTRFVHVVHPNPKVRAVVEANRGLPNVRLVEPLDYREFTDLLRRCRLVLTDSGGVQEEAPTFGKPVLVLREKTERPEGVEAGIARLVGTDPDEIFTHASRLLTDAESRRAMRARGNPYGDGHAADRIAQALLALEERAAALPAAEPARVS